MGRVSPESWPFPRLKALYFIAALRRSIKERRKKLNGYMPESTALQATCPEYIKHYSSIIKTDIIDITGQTTHPGCWSLHSEV